MLLETLRKLHERVVQTADDAEKRSSKDIRGVAYMEGMAEAFKEAFNMVRRGA
jgi:hypothetical protein